MNFSHLLWRHLSFPPVISPCYSVSSHPVFLGKWKKGQQICCSLLIASGVLPNSETSVTLQGFMHLIKGKSERPSPQSGFYKRKTSRYTQSNRTTRMRVLWERWEVKQHLANTMHEVSAQLLQVIGEITWFFGGTSGYRIDKFLFWRIFICSVLNMAGSFPLVYLWNSSELSLSRITSTLFQR